MTNAKTYLILIAVSLLVWATISYAFTNKTIEQQIEEQNTAILQDCLSKARVKEVPSEILESASHCNKDLLKTIYSPLYSRTGATMNATGSKVPEPLWFQLIPQASANSVSFPKPSIKETVQNIRTPKQIYEQVKHLGYREAPTISLIQSCKASSLRPDHCILVWLTLMYNESGNQQNSKACTDRNNCFGINSWKKVYASLDEWMENWVQKYNLLWYKAESPSFFYSSAWKLSPSRYCVSEESSNTEIGCPRWLMIATTKWKQLKLILNNGN